MENKTAHRTSLVCVPLCVCDIEMSSVCFRPNAHTQTVVRRIANTLELRLALSHAPHTGVVKGENLHGDELYLSMGFEDPGTPTPS